MTIIVMWRVLSVLGMVVAGLLAGCNAQAGSDGGPSVVASFYPLAYVAERVAGDHAQVRSLTTAGVEPHDLELTVQQSMQVADADLVVYERGLQPAVDESVAQSDPPSVVDATAVLGLASTSASGDAGDGSGDANLHFWLDPALLADVAQEVTDQLEQTDPGHASDYRANLAALRDDLDTLDREYRHGLADCRVDTVVVSHDAFGYLERYGLSFAAISGLSPDAEPSAARIRALQQLVVDEGVSTIFSETLASPELAETLARDVSTLR